MNAAARCGLIAFWMAAVATTYAHGSGDVVMDARENPHILKRGWIINRLVAGKFFKHVLVNMGTEASFSLVVENIDVEYNYVNVEGITPTELYFVNVGWAESDSGKCFTHCFSLWVQRLGWQLLAGEWGREIVVYHKVEWEPLKASDVSQFEGWRLAIVLDGKRSGAAVISQSQTERFDGNVSPQFMLGGFPSNFIRVSGGFGRLAGSISGPSGKNGSQEAEYAERNTDFKLSSGVMSLNFGSYCASSGIQTLILNALGAIAGIWLIAGGGRLLFGNDCGPWGLPGNWPWPHAFGALLLLFAC
jgi:hypothetical protein